MDEERKLKRDVRNFRRYENARDERKMKRWKNQLLFERILKDATTPLQMTLEILLWRGFLAAAHEGVLYLSRGSHEEDIALLRRFLKVEKIPAPVEHGEADPVDKVPSRWRHRWESGIFPDVICEITPTDNKRTLFKLLTESFQSTGMIGNLDFFRGPGENQKFGRRVPVKWLDPGVALLTKVLPLLRLEVWYSCEGHDEKSPPEIRFAHKEDLRWARVVLPQFLPPEDPFIRHWTMKQGDSWAEQIWLLDKHGCKDDPEATYDMYWNIQRLCRNILNGHWDKRGIYCPHRSLATKARQVCGEKMEWLSPHCWYNPEKYLFSEEHANGTVELPLYIEVHPVRTIVHHYIMPPESAFAEL